jgi:hypothetical protein
MSLRLRSASAPQPRAAASASASTRWAASTPRWLASGAEAFKVFLPQINSISIRHSDGMGWLDSLMTA